MQYGTQALNTPRPLGANLNAVPDPDQGFDQGLSIKEELDAWRYVLKRKVRTFEKRKDVKQLSGNDLDQYWESEQQQIIAEFGLDDSENKDVALEVAREIYLQKVHDLAKEGTELTTRQIKALLEDYNDNARESVLGKGFLKSRGFSNWKDVAYKTGSTEGEVGLPPEHKNFFQNLPDDVKDLVRGGGVTLAATAMAMLVTGGGAAPLLGAGIAKELFKLGAKKTYRERKVKEDNLGREARDELLSTEGDAQFHINEALPDLRQDTLSQGEANARVRHIIRVMHDAPLARVRELRGVNMRSTIFEAMAGLTGTGVGGLGGSLVEAYSMMNDALENGFAMKDGKVIGFQPGEQMNEMRRTATGVWQSAGHMVEKGVDGLFHPVMEQTDIVAAKLNGWASKLGHFASNGQELLKYSIPGSANVGEQLFSLGYTKTMNTFLSFGAFVHAAYEGLDAARKQFGGVIDNLHAEKIRAHLQQIPVPLPLLQPPNYGTQVMPSTPAMPPPAPPAAPPSAPPSSVVHSGPSVPVAPVPSSVPLSVPSPAGPVMPSSVGSPSSPLQTPSTTLQAPSTPSQPPVRFTPPDLSDISIPVAPRPISQPSQSIPVITPDTTPLITPDSVAIPAVIPGSADASVEAKKSIPELVHEVVSSPEIEALRNKDHLSYAKQYDSIDITFNNWDRRKNGGRHIVYCANPDRLAGAFDEVMKIKQQDKDAEIKLVMGKKPDTGDKHAQQIVKNRMQNMTRDLVLVTNTVDFHPYISAIASQLNDKIENEAFKFNYHQII